MMKKITLFAFMALMMSVAFGQAPAYKTITQLRTNDVNGIPNSGDTNSTVMTSGIVYGPNQYPTPNGRVFILNDHNRGLKVYSKSTFGYNISDGDSVVVIGRTTNYNGICELFLKNSIQYDTIYKVGVGVMDSPRAVSPNALDETTESQLVIVQNIDMSVVANNTFAAKQAAAMSAGKHSFSCKAGANGAILYMFIDSFMSAALYNWTAPTTGIYNVVGLGDQYTTTPPYNAANSYQINPRSPNDFRKVTNVGINEVNKEILAAYIYPNPATTQINVYMNFDQSDQVTAHIYDLTGREVVNSAFEMFKGDNTVQIGTANLTNGLYILELTSTSGKSMTAKVNVVK